MRDLIKLWVDDVTATQKRIRDDVSHLRELGKRGKIVARVAAGEVKAKVEKLAGNVADGILYAESIADRMRGGKKP